MRLFRVLIGSFFLFVAGCASKPAADIPTTHNSSPAAAVPAASNAPAAAIPSFAGSAAKYAGAIEGEYHIGVDDRVQVSVWKNPDISVVVPVRPDGMISVPLVGDVPAAGNTPSKLAEIIRHKLSAYIRDPNVTVIVTDLRSHDFLTRVRVTGAVRTPRTMPYRQGMTVLDAVLEAGGINDFAAPNRTKLYRETKSKTEVFDIELGDILQKGGLATNMGLEPGDVITVPERLF